MNSKKLKRRVGFIVKPLLTPLKVKNKKNALHYAKSHKKNIFPNTIFFEAYLGKSMTGNSLALFKKVYNDSRFNKYTFIWSVCSLDSVPSEYRNAKNVRFIIRDSKSYAKYLARSEYLVTDTTFPQYFNKRKDEQTYIMAWHGTPYKTIGKDIQHTSKNAHNNVMKNMLHTDYFISPSEFTTKTILNSQDSYDLFAGTVVEAGMPRTDLMFSADKKMIKDSLRLSHTKKIVLYAPTWNDFINNANVTAAQLASDVTFLQQTLGDEYEVYLKAHYLEYDAIKDMTSSVKLIANSVDTNVLLSVVDHLVTDYSSIFFDFLPSKKPIHFYFKNYEEFDSGRGFYLTQDELPGTRSETLEHLASTILNETKKTFSPYEAEINRFSPYDDGHVSERIINFIFFNQDISNGTFYKPLTKKEKIIFYAGFFKNNGITESFIRMSNHLDYSKYHLTLIMPTNLRKNPSVELLLNRLHPSITLLFPSGTRTNLSIKDEYSYKLFMNRGLNGFVKKLNIPTIFNSEFHRLVGNTPYDKAIDFSGYSAHFGALIGFSDTSYKSIFLHSDMVKDKERVVNKKRPNKLNLQALFSIYNHFDKLISVSQSSFQANLQKIGKPLHLVDKMTYVINYLDGDRINQLKNQYTELKIDDTVLLTELLPSTSQNEVLDVKGIPEPNSNMINYVTLGRLSPEKNQALLIQSFALVLDKQPNSKLYIIGDGPQRNKLTTLVSQLNIVSNVVFVGHMNNPFLLLNKCDIFVLTSLYEGQALVILEALTLGLNVISTDIPGPDNILKEGYGELVEATDIGLAQKMLQIATPAVSYRKFDADEYDQEAIRMFENILDA